MSNEERGTTVQLDDDELQALQAILRDWINEQLVTPPYPAAVTSVFRKLGVMDQTDEPAPGSDVLRAADRPVQLDNMVRST